MDMPINIVPAPFGAFVALYLGTNNLVVHRHCSVQLDEDEHDGDQLYYTIRPVVAWGLFKHTTHGVMNHPLVADEHGRLVFAGMQTTEEVPKVLSQFRDNYLGNLSFDSVCTAVEAELRIEQIKAEDSHLKVERWGNALFASGNSVDLPANVRL